MRLSVITVNRNNARGLDATIRSVLSQTDKSIEYIIVDGGSSDGSTDVIKQYHECISKWISEPDQGIYDAMNKGIALATGTYCIFMNSGDVFASAEVVDRALFGQDCDIISGFSMTSSGNRITPPPSLNFRYLYHRNIPHQAEFIKRSLFERIGLYSVDLKILADYEFNIKAGLNDVSYCEIPVNVAVVEEGGISETQLDVIENERKLIFSRLFPASVLSDYEYWLDPATFAHPTVKWLISRPRLMRVVKKIQKL